MHKFSFDAVYLAPSELTRLSNSVTMLAMIGVV